MRRRIDGVEASVREPSSSGSLLERTRSSSPALSEAQSKVDSLCSQFIEQAADPVALVSLCAGGLAYRMGRFGTLAIGGGHVTAMPLRLFSYAIGLGSEVTAFEFTNRVLPVVGATLCGRPQFSGSHTGLPLQETNPNLWSFSGPGGWAEGLSQSAVTFGILRGASFLARDQNFVFRHLFQDTATVGGHRLSSSLGISPPPEDDLGEQFLFAELTNLQLEAGMGLVYSAAPGLAALERGMDVSLQSAVGTGIPPLSNLVHARAGGSPALRERTPLLPENIHFMSSFKEEGSGKTPEEIAAGYRRSFPIGLRNTERIITTALATPLKDPLLYERLLEAYAQSENRGQLEQLYTAVAIKDLFAHNAQHTPVGSFDNALFQALITRVLSENDPSLRKARSQSIFQAMEDGSLSRSKMESFLKEWGYEKAFRARIFPRFSFAFWKSQGRRAAEALKGYRLADKALLMNFIFSMEVKKPETLERIFKIFKEARRSDRYPAQALDEALSYARRHPAGALVLRRLLNLLAVEDAPVKLRELQGPPDERKTLPFIAELARQGKTGEEIAETINGTRHTAYFDDLRLARKIVATSLEVHPRLIGKTEERGPFRARLYEAMNSFLVSGKKLDAVQLIRLLEVNGGPELERFHRQWAERKFDFEVVSGELFEHIVKVYGQIPDCEESIFITVAGAQQRRHLAKKTPPPRFQPDYERFLERVGERPQILIREMPPGIPGSHKAKESALRNLRFRLWGLLHEWGHFLHHSGTDEVIRKEEGPISLSNINRQNRLITEIWAFLQEQPWRVKNIDIDPWIIGERLGENFPLYMRHLNDQSYFREVNRKLMEQMGIGEEP